MLVLTLWCSTGLPLPAGATLISPWVDLAHSFPSIMNDDSGDYIPSRGFHYRPGLEWPPLPDAGPSIVLEGEEETILLAEQMQMYASNALLSHPMVSPVNQGSLGGLPPLYIVRLQLLRLARSSLTSCLQCAGSAELLQDEIIYIAHKAASPSSYPPSPATLSAYPSQQKHLDADYPPTLVQLQVFDDACHVATTLSITSLAKYMYRGCANFGLWALTAASKKAEREIAEGTGHHHHHHHHSHSHPHSHSSSSTSSPPSRMTPLSASSSTSATSSSSSLATHPVLAALASRDALDANYQQHDLSDDSQSEADSESSCSSLETDDDVGNGTTSGSAPVVCVTGHIPPFEDHMVRQRVSTTGRLRPLEPADALPATTVQPASVGRLHQGPVRKWMAERAKYDDKYRKDLEYYRSIRRMDRDKAEATGFLQGKFEGEQPPLSSLAGWSDEQLALRCGQSVDEIGKKVNMALASWARISQAPDEEMAGGAVKIGEVSHKLDEMQVGKEGEDVKEDK